MISRDSLQESIEALERTINELQALTMIYNEFNDVDNHQYNGDAGSLSTNFKILTENEYELAKELIEQEVCEFGIIPDLRVEINLNFTHESTGDVYVMKLQVTLPKGYPKSASAIVSIVSIDNLKSNRSQRDELANFLNEKAKELAESDAEALMELVQSAQDCAPQYLCALPSSDNSESIDDVHGETNESLPTRTSLSRRWIWVHHITNNNRCKDIVQEARDRKLSGYLKRGYPGIIVIEGDSLLCDKYVQWVKGNKSRPGGFGRNWGHHVRGEVMLQSGNADEEPILSRAFVNDFQDIGEDLAAFASMCRQVEMEDEFKNYIMQH